MKIDILFLAVLLPAALVRAADANVISIETGTTINISGTRAQVIVTTANRGDEAAHNVKAGMEIGGRQFSGRLKETLSPREQYSEEFNAELEFKKPGRYPVVVNIDYTDANLYPFSALSATYINYGESLNARVAGMVAPVTLAKNGRINLTVNNLDAVERKFHFRVIAPKEIVVTNPEGEIAVASGTEKKVSLDIRNISALPGSSYPVFALLGYEDDKYYYSTINTGIITVVRNKSLLDAYQWPLLIVLAVLVAIVIAYNSGRLRDRGAKVK